jgi:hypothetical protein
MQRAMQQKIPYSSPHEKGGKSPALEILEDFQAFPEETFFSGGGALLWHDISPFPRSFR